MHDIPKYCMLAVNQIFVALPTICLRNSTMSKVLLEQIFWSQLLEAYIHLQCWLSKISYKWCRVSQVTREGKYLKSDIPRQLVYGTMVYVRQNIVSDSSCALSRAICIAIRYSAVRRQFGSQDGSPEAQVIKDIFFFSFFFFFNQQHKLCLKEEKITKHQQWKKGTRALYPTHNPITQ